MRTSVLFLTTPCPFADRYKNCSLSRSVSLINNDAIQPVIILTHLGDDSLIINEADLVLASQIISPGLIEKYWIFTLPP